MIPVRHYTRKPARQAPEFLEQKALFDWARNAATLRTYPSLDLLSCSLNGVKLSRAQAGKAKATGMLAGEHDVKLPVPRGVYVGLSIEMKAGRNKATADQVWYGGRLEEEGWCVHYCWSWVEAKEAIEHYLSLPPFSFARSGAVL